MERNVGRIWVSVLGLIVLPSGAFADEPVFLRGDSNADGKVSTSDALMTSRALFLHGLDPSDCHPDRVGTMQLPCLAAADANDDSFLDIIDMVQILNTILGFTGHPQIAAPFPEVGPDPTPNAQYCDAAVPSCQSYEVEPAQETDDLIRIGDIVAGAGEEVLVPIYLTSSVAVEGVQLVLRYNPELFTPEQRPGKKFDFEGGPWAGLPPKFVQAVTVVPGEDFLVVAAVGSSDGYRSDLDPIEPVPYPPIPSGTDTLIFKIRGRVSPNAPVGTDLVLEPWNGPDGQGVRPPYNLLNEITHKGVARYVSLLPQLRAGRIGILDDITLFFKRGDANSDATVDIGDAVYVLNYLFLGGAEPKCEDAADADDNGKLEITDPVVILDALFTGSAKIAVPYPTAGKDPSLDDFEVCINSSS